MHQTRAQTSKKLPIARKGTKYVARSLSSLKNSVPVIIAVRDMLKLARTKKEVKEMIKQKLLKINEREVRDYREGIMLFNVFQADKSYILSLTNHGKFKLEETKAKDRIAKLVGKKILKGRKTQLNFHDGSNLISEEKINVGDTVYFDLSGKIKNKISLKEGADCFVMSGKYIGSTGKIQNVEGKKIKIKIKDMENSVTLDEMSVIAR
ncbi:hypothetical protein HY450_03150 [Candidatus Pacearchaeota archaeon]|nr:hypothetical protein [Candidatus Pacearchaeota archaeon]